jgi:ABC-2 type transport system permease protein
MQAHIFKHEWRNLRVDKTLWLIAGLMSGVISYGLYNGISWVGFQSLTLQAVHRHDEEKVTKIRNHLAQLAQGATPPAFFLDPRQPAYAGGPSIGARHAIMPPAPLAALSIGQSDLYSYYFLVSTRSKHTFLSNDEIQNPTHC